MGLLFVGVIAGVLIGFGWFAPSRGYFLGCASRPCFDSVAVARPADPTPKVSASDPAIVKSNSAAPARSGKTSSPKKRRSADLAKAASPRTRISVPASERPAEKSDPVLDKAKVAIAAKLEDPGSVEFSDMKRAMRKNTFGRPVDTICGRLKTITASGAIGERPFLYLVKEDEAYVVDGKSGSAASTAYRNICN
ncbi:MULTISPECIES: hypothetical protein [unclassified Bradyrhizobium]|uniref:hypothetical protein n=1 Tax=unclassified Bradyrhizobium TaxID=2631580 RepID=UPI002478E0C8|nr:MULTISPECIES: hypothetical protein [unclassified Bradyrhizobium]WGR73422.1 hypothetical protein MTX24_11660 [Bradyrhizobium sp. ISRA426]WGR78259.1 hypothetical protein MTX21_36630 [Bradyrhizobium sp. ISRA430]WGR88660.1 hypothetical protein MTX25_11670 [Bradyrhizobium sp. ISRA432]